MGQMIEFKRPDGSVCGGYLAEAGQGRPGLVVIQEWWGLNAQICGIADRFAAAGVAAEIHRYEAAHAFFNERRPEVYDAACAALAWERSVAFLTAHLA
ncbi:MAG: dienelactone hydrolase family protein [Rhodocyclales bacterium]|nr:dienelactone hydrolase family protein [Rhodocyclales bacterium]